MNHILFYAVMTAVLVEENKQVVLVVKCSTSKGCHSILHFQEPSRSWMHQVISNSNCIFSVSQDPQWITT